MAPGGCPSCSQVWTESHWLHPEGRWGWWLSEDRRGWGTERKQRCCRQEHNGECAKSQGNELSDLAKVRLHQHVFIPPHAFFVVVVVVVSVYDHLSHFQVQSVTFNECPEIGAAGPERKGIVFLLLLLLFICFTQSLSFLSLSDHSCFPV